MILKDFLKIDWLRENLALLLAVPTLIGGIWQVISLLILGLPFLRFFSLSQLVADGVLLLFFLLFIYIVVLGVWRGYGKSTLATGRTDISKKQRVLMIIIKAACISYFLNLCYDNLSDLSIRKQLDLGDIALIVVALSVAFFTITSILKDLVLMFKVDLDSNKKVPSYISTPIGMLLLAMAFLFIFEIIPWLHRSFVSAMDFGNERYIECAIKKRYPNRIRSNIKYFNDKYVFVRVVRPGYEFIEVLKFEEFLDGNACVDVPADSIFIEPSFPEPFQFK